MTEANAATNAATEITRSVASIWERRGGTRATSVDTQIDGDRIRCRIEGGKAAESAGTDSNAYRHEASAAVARITKRTVSAYIAKRDEGTGIATQTFILERARIKF